MSDITCKDFRGLLDRLLDGEATPEERARMDAHAAECPDCAALREALLGDLQAVTDALEDVPPMPAGTHEAWMDAVRAEQAPARAGKRRAWLRWGSIAAAALYLVGGTWLAKDRLKLLVDPGDLRPAVQAAQRPAATATAAPAGTATTLPQPQATALPRETPPVQTQALANGLTDTDAVTTAGRTDSVPEAVPAEAIPAPEEVPAVEEAAAEEAAPVWFLFAEDAAREEPVAAAAAETDWFAEAEEDAAWEEPAVAEAAEPAWFADAEEAAAWEEPTAAEEADWDEYAPEEEASPAYDLFATEAPAFAAKSAMLTTPAPTPPWEISAGEAAVAEPAETADEPEEAEAEPAKAEAEPAMAEVEPNEVPAEVEETEAWPAEAPVESAEAGAEPAESPAESEEAKARPAEALAASVEAASEESPVESEKAVREEKDGGFLRYLPLFAAINLPLFGLIALAVWLARRSRRKRGR